jgi:hypothetical protein
LANGKSPGFTRVAGLLLGLALIIGAVNNEPIKLSNQLIPTMPAPGATALQVLVGIVGIVLLLWGLDPMINNEIGRALGALRATALPRPSSEQLIFVPLKSQIVRGRHPNARWVDAECTWQVAEGSGNLTIVRAEFRKNRSRKWREAARIQNDDGYVIATFPFPLDVPSIDRLSTEAGLVRLTDGWNRQHWSKVTLSQNPT